MKNIFTLSILLLSATLINAQTTAQDWTLTDCSSNSHTLFTYLDAEEVVVMEFGMGCGSCYVAADALYSLKQKYAVEQPGKVNFFYMDYWSGNTCSGDVNPVLSASPLDAGFNNCQSQLSYYMSGSPMPAIVIVAGSNHLVLFEKNSFAYADTTTMITEIDNFFATVGFSENVSESIQLNVFPNPASNSVSVESTGNGSLQITDASGKNIYNVEISEGSRTIDISAWSSGYYLFELITEKGTVRQKLLKN